MSRHKVFMHHFGDAIAGWVAGVATTVVIGLIWPIIFPAVVRIEHYYGAGPGLLLIIAMVIVVASPAALLGGLVGGALAIEGGDQGRRMIAMVLGIVFSIPCAAWGFWYFTGW